MPPVTLELPQLEWRSGEPQSVQGPGVWPGSATPETLFATQGTWKNVLSCGLKFPFLIYHIPLTEQIQALGVSTSVT